MLLCHRAGLPAIRRSLPRFAMYDWALMTSALAEEEPWWEPGRTHGYHVNTFGFLIGEIVRRVSGERIGAFFRRAAPRRWRRTFTSESDASTTSASPTISSAANRPSSSMATRSDSASCAVST